MSRCILITGDENIIKVVYRYEYSSCIMAQADKAYEL